MLIFRGGVGWNLWGISSLASSTSIAGGRWIPEDQGFTSCVGVANGVVVAPAGGGIFPGDRAGAGGRATWIENLDVTLFPCFFCCVFVGSLAFDDCFFLFVVFEKNPWFLDANKALCSWESPCLLYCRFGTLALTFIKYCDVLCIFSFRFIIIIQKNGPYTK